jgi:hypothetical protein
MIAREAVSQRVLVVVDLSLSLPDLETPSPLLERTRKFHFFTPM